MTGLARRFAVSIVGGLLLLGAGRLVALPQAADTTSDSAITTAIQTKVSQDAALKTQDIHVSTQQGVVTLTGTVDTEQQQAAVDGIASTEPGVVKVVDGLSVKGSANSESAQAQYSAPAQAAPQNPYPNSENSQDQSVPSTLTLPTGTLVTVRLMQALSSSRNHAGDTFAATLEEPLVANGWVVMRQGQTVLGRVAVVRKAGRIKGVSELGLDLSRITLVDGQQLPIRTRLVKATASSSRGRDVAAVGTTTAIGAIIGTAADWGAGAGIGAAAGAAVGVAGVLLTRGRPTVIMPETLLTFRLESPATFSTDQGRVAFRPVTPEDYPRNELQHRPAPYTAGPPRYGYPPPPYWGYYWGPYYPYYFGFGYYHGPRYYRRYRGR